VSDQPKTDRTGAPNVELRPEDKGQLDDVDIHTPTLVRIERMDRGHSWERVEVADEPAVVFNFHSDSEIRAYAELDE